MKAFLSHSSNDRPIVEKVAEVLGGAVVELDSISFEHGQLNSDAIFSALRRSSLYVLFLSDAALQSGYVRFEARLAQELVARGAIERFLVICLDERSFSAADEQWKIYNFVRKAVSYQAIARLIQSQLIVLRSKSSTANQPFVGRSKELHDAKEKLIDPNLAKIKALFVSGNAGIGRRTFANQLFRDVFPAVSRVLPEIGIEKLDGFDEIYRRIYDVFSPISSLSALRARFAGFALENDVGKARLAAQLLDSVLEAREAIFIRDLGGLLSESGAFQPAVKAILEHVKAFPHPPLIFVAERMMPNARRNEVPGIVFCSLPALERGEVRQLLALLLKREDISYSNDDLGQLIDLSDGHPFNVSFMVEAARQYGLKAFLSDTTELLSWKRRRATEFLKGIQFDDVEVRVLAALKDFRMLDFDTLVEAAASDTTTVGRSVMRLIDYHIVEPSSGMYQVSPPLRLAVERDVRLSVNASDHKRILKAVGNILTVVNEAESVNASMINAAIVATLDQGEEIPPIFGAFLLPSHYVWLARRRYDARQFPDCIQLANAALEGEARLSPAGITEVCRVLCLAASRLGDENQFRRGIAILKKVVKDRWTRSNVNFLLGFHARLRGNYPEAEEHLRSAINDTPGNFHATRELASICMVRGDLEAAEQFARAAYETAPDNPFILDILLAVLIKRLPRGAQDSEAEMSLLFEKLKKANEESGRSFYQTRRAEYEYKKGNLPDARRLIDEAVAATPSIFNVHEMRFEICLEQGNKTVAFDEIRRMRDIVYRDAGTERLTNLRSLLEAEASYLRSKGDFAAAKEIYLRRDVFTEKECEQATKDIEYEQGYRAR